MDTKKYIFLCGLHRSGTTILQETLGKSPLISQMKNTGHAQNEGQHFQTVYKNEWAFGGPGCFANNVLYHYTTKSELITAQNNAKLISEWGKYWDVTKPILLEKSPPNLIHTLYLQEVVNQPYFIVIIRHPVPVAAASVKQSWVREKSIENHIKHWLRAHDIFFQDKPFIKKCFIINYEKIDNDPSLAGKISAFLEEDIEKSNIRFDKFKNEDNQYLGKHTIDSTIIEKYENEINKYGYSFLPPYYLQNSNQN